MSQIMEKTLASLPKLLTQGLIGGGGPKPQQRQGPSMDVQNFMTYVHRARTKSHEAQIVKSELSNVRQKLKETDLVSSPSVLHRCFTKALFCHLLGYNVSFVAIHAVNLAQQARGYDKRLGYLMSCLLLNPHHEMVMLMMATLLRDIQSSNMADNCIALKVAGELVDAETIPSLLPELMKKFNHPHELVQEKAIHCFGAFYRRSPELLQQEIGRLNVFLTSRDPGVLMAVVNIFVSLTSQNPSHFVKLGSSFLHILNQINNRGFGSSYYCNMIPLPWLQISLLKVLGNVGQEDPQLSMDICPILKSLIEKTKVSVPISLAVLVESIRTATKIQPNDALLQLCSRCIMKLLASDSSENMRYQGLGLLIALSRVKPSFASQHQVAVIECLNNEDPTIQSRTALLLHAMANRANIKAICSKLFEQLDRTKEILFRHDIFRMISDLVERLSPDIDWYISTNLKILSHELTQNAKDEIVDLVLRKVEDLINSQANVSVDKTVVNNLTETLLSVMEKQNYELAEFSLAVQLLGRLTPLLQEEFSTDRFLDVIAKFLVFSTVSMADLDRSSAIYPPHHFSDTNVVDRFVGKNMVKLKSQCVVIVMKLVLHQCVQPSSVVQWLDCVRPAIKSKNSFLLSDLDELSHLVRNPQDLKVKSSIFCQSLQAIDYSLSFLDSLVVRDILEGNQCYKPMYIRRRKLSELQDLSTPTDTIEQNSLVDSSLINNSDDSVMEESQISIRKLPSKWRDDDNEDDEQAKLGQDVGYESGSEKQVELNKQKKAAEELFAGLNENDTDFDDGNKPPLSLSSLSGSTSKPSQKWGKSIWDDDENDNNVDEAKKFSIFDMGKISLNPFGISKNKSKAKSMQWTEDIGDDEEEAKNDNNNQLDHFLYNSSSETQITPMNFTESFLSDDDIPWSDHRESWSSAQEAVPSIYSNLLTGKGSDSFATSLDTDAMSESTVDALTDSDPDATDS